MKHKEAGQKVRDAERGLQQARDQARARHQNIVKPGKSLRDDNNFASIVRDSLRIGHTEN